MFGCSKFFSYFCNVMTQDFESNKKRIERLGFTCGLIDDNGKVRNFIDGHEYIEIGGIKWATCNVGAEKETDSGLYFQWGDVQGYTSDQYGFGEGKKCFTWVDYKYVNNNTLTKYNSTDGKTVLEPSDDAARFHMGGSWRMPTEEDFQKLLASTTNKWVFNYKGSGVNGRLFTSMRDSSKTLFFPTCGYCGYGSIGTVGTDGYYWSSSLNSSGVFDSYNLSFGVKFCRAVANGRNYGFSVRGVINY